jgi:hypothetical protein
MQDRIKIYIMNTGDSQMIDISIKMLAIIFFSLNTCLSSFFIFSMFFILFYIITKIEIQKTHNYRQMF